MKIFYISISVILVIIFAFSIRNTIHLLSKETEASDMMQGGLKSSLSDLHRNKDYMAIEDMVVAKIQTTKDSITKVSTWDIAIGLAVTLLTGISTLLTTIGTIKKSDLSQRTAITIAILSFFSSTLSYASGQLETVKKELETKQEKLSSISTELETINNEEEFYEKITAIKRELAKYQSN